MIPLCNSSPPWARGDALIKYENYKGIVININYEGVLDPWEVGHCIYSLSIGMFNLTSVQ